MTAVALRGRTDIGSRIIWATPQALYDAFLDPQAVAPDHHAVVQHELVRFDWLRTRAATAAMSSTNDTCRTLAAGCRSARLVASL